MLVIRIGDFGSEHSLLDPLAASVADGARLLFPGNTVRLESLRTLPGLEIVWHDAHAVVSTLILVGHGKSDGLLFGRYWASADEIVEKLRPCVPHLGFSNLRIISLCCRTGLTGIASGVSSGLGCSWVGPTEAALGSECASFVGSLLTSHYQGGYQWLTAMKRTRESFSTVHYASERQAPWALWVNGTKAAGRTRNARHR